MIFIDRAEELAILEQLLKRQRGGATADAQALLDDHSGLLIDLPMLYADLADLLKPASLL